MMGEQRDDNDAPAGWPTFSVGWEPFKRVSPHTPLPLILGVSSLVLF